LSQPLKLFCHKCPSLAGHNPSHYPAEQSVEEIDP
jgi:hypothetical protein